MPLSTDKKPYKYCTTKLLPRTFTYTVYIKPKRLPTKRVSIPYQVREAGCINGIVSLSRHKNFLPDGHRSLIKSLLRGVKTYLFLTAQEVRGLLLKPFAPCAHRMGDGVMGALISGRSGRSEAVSVFFSGFQAIYVQSLLFCRKK